MTDVLDPKPESSDWWMMRAAWWREEVTRRAETLQTAASSFAAAQAAVEYAETMARKPEMQMAEDLTNSRG